MKKTHDLEVQDIDIESRNDQREWVSRIAQFLHLEMWREFFSDFSQSGIEFQDLIVRHLLPNAACDLQNIAQLQAELDLGDHVANRRRFRVWSGGRQKFGVRSKLFVKNVVRDLSVTVVVIDHTG